MSCKRWGQQIALVLGSHSSAVSYRIQLFTWADQPVLLAGRRITERDPLHPAARLGLSPSVWGRDPRIPGILRLVLLAGETGWLAGWALQDGREGRDGGGIMTADYTYCGDLQAGNSPPGTNLLQGSSFHPFFPCCWLRTPASASCKVHICALPFQNPKHCCCFQWSRPSFAEESGQRHAIACQCNGENVFIGAELYYF